MKSFIVRYSFVCRNFERYGIDIVQARTKWGAKRVFMKHHKRIKGEQLKIVSVTRPLMGFIRKEAKK